MKSAALILIAFSIVWISFAGFNGPAIAILIVSITALVVETVMKKLKFI
jgi:hypothetical protein